MTAKVPFPRQLTSSETLDTLTHWKSHVRNYFRRDDGMKEFFARTATWAPSRTNYGFVGDDAAIKADNLESLLDTIAGFMPGPYLTNQITGQTKCIDDVFRLIWRHYDVDPTPSTFLDFNNLNLEKDERYIDLFYRMVYHSEQHLVKAGTQVENQVVSVSESISHSHKNLIALNWLQTINKNLVNIVKLEKSNELKNGSQLHVMVHDIAKNIDEWLKRHGHDSKSKILPEVNTDSQVRYVYNDSYTHRGTTRGRSMGRGRYHSRGSSNFRGANRSAGDPFCPGCNYLSKELQLNVEYKHFPSQCPRKKSVLRLLSIEESNLEEEDTNASEHDVEEDTAKPDPYQGNSSISDIKDLNIRKIWKSKSPEINAFLNDTAVKAIIDEGSEISAISSNIQKQLNLSISRNVELAKSAGSQTLAILGETTKDVWINVTTSTGKIIQWNLGQCLVIENLGCDVLIGEPAKAFNNITTHSALRQATSTDINDTKLIVPYASAMSNVFKVDFNSKATIYPNQMFHVKVPDSLKHCNEILVESTECNEFPAPGIYDVKNGQVALKNDSNNVVSVEKENPLFLSSLRKVYDINNQSMKQYEKPFLPKPITELFDFNQIKLDPDNILSYEWKTVFRDILTGFTDILTEMPGRYNGYYGQVPCTLTLTGTLPPSLKPRLPNYPDEKLKVMANLMDKMESWGVLVKPETIGIVPSHVHPCILVPKDNGKFRMVTDFRSIQQNILQLPTIMPTVADAMKDLADSNYHVELDFSNYYWQNAIPREDSEKLAVVHPYGGLRVYTVLPQGLRNSAEWGSEILARTFGDMVKDKKCTRIADQIYILGNTLTEVAANLKEVLHRAKLAGLTFKPEKIVVCPKSTVILGWKKQGNKWFPTDHVISPLSEAEPPSTVKKLRGWLGAYRQIAKSIPNHSASIQTFEKLVGGKNSRDRIVWTPELLSQFDISKASVKTTKAISFPRPSDTLQIYSDWSQDADAIGGRLLIIRNLKGEKITLNGTEFSCRLKGAQSKWTPCEKECLAIKLLVQHYQPFIRENKNVTTIFTDNIVTVHAWNAIQTGRVSTSSRVASFVSTLCENNVKIVHIPGIHTVVADYNSRHPVECKEIKCQICNYVNKEVVNHDAYIRSITQLDSTPLTQRNAWLDLQKKDPTHNALFKLIKNGQTPEKKSRNKSVKLLHNLYKRGVLFVAKDDLIQVKHPDLVHNIEYNAISIPETYISPLVQSLHLKYNHASAYQLNKIMSRQFYCTGMSSTIQQISASCNTCIRLKTLPKEIREYSTSPSECFGKYFSADILIEKGQFILLCREKLSQFTLTKIISDETASTLESALITMLADLVPDSGSTVQVDAATSFQSLAEGKGKSLSNFNIQLDIGRINNKQKNPIAENAIKELRKEWLRLKPNGDSLSEIDLATITSLINSRIRLNGLAPKEVMLKRSIHDHQDIQVQDILESSGQYERRVKSNNQAKVKDSLIYKKPTKPDIKVGDLVYLKNDLSKSRAREEYITVKVFVKGGETWLLIRKTEKQFRNKDYLVKLSEVVAAPMVEVRDDGSDDEDLISCHGFQEDISLDKRNRIKQAVNSLEHSLQGSSVRGRPRVRYPDYLKPLSDDVIITEEDECLTGFNNDDVMDGLSKKERLQNIIAEMEKEDDNASEAEEELSGYNAQEVECQEDRRRKLQSIIEDLEDDESTNMVRNMNIKESSKNKYPWNQEEWLEILELDDDYDVQVKVEVDEEALKLLKNLPSPESQNISLDDYFQENVESLTFDDSEFMTPNNTKGLFHLNSETDPNIIDKIPVIDTSESDTENDVFLQSVLHCSSPIQWSPQRINCNENQNLEQHLQHMQQIHPQINTVVQNRVQDMETILAGIESHAPLPKQAQAPKTRLKKRYDYKKVNKQGFSDNK